MTLSIFSTETNAQPVITQQPTNLMADLGDSTTISVTATGTGALSYQWLKDGKILTGQTGSSLNLVSVNLQDVGYYRVRVSDSVGSEISGAALLTVTPYSGTVVAWGTNYYGYSLTNVPTGLSNVVAMSAGVYHTAALKSDGTVVAWGDNRYGQTNVPDGLSGVVAIAADDLSTLALKSDGTVVAWGWNTETQTDIPDGLSGVVAIAAGGLNTAALKSDGTVVAWGNNVGGQTNVPDGLSGVVAIAAGVSHMVALKSDGTVVAWGYNGSGQTDIPDGLSNVVAIAAGELHSVALKSDGTVVAWGYHVSPSVTNVPSDLNDAVAIAARGYHTAALKSDGTVVAWGDYSNIPSGLSGVVAITAGYYHTAALVGGFPPLISSHPTNLTVNLGDSATFSVTATGTGPLSYQWYREGVLLEDGGNVSGSTSETLILTNVIGNDAGGYTVVISNYFGAITSSVASLTVVLPPEGFEISSISESEVTLQFYGTPNQPYIMQTATNLTSPVTWNPILTNLTDAGGFWSNSITIIPTLPESYYRVVRP